MTTQERLRELAHKYRWEKNTQTSNGIPIHELLDRAAKEMDDLMKVIAGQHD